MEAFPPGTLFFDVEDVPVARIESPRFGYFAFDPYKRPFPVESVDRNGMMVSEEKFRELVARSQAAR